MATVTVDLRLRVCWWVRPYMHLVVLWAWLRGAEPDLEKVTATCMRGIKVSLVDGRPVLLSASGSARGTR